jgi:hypothetical protein
VRSRIQCYVCCMYLGTMGGFYQACFFVISLPAASWVIHAVAIDLVVFVVRRHCLRRRRRIPSPVAPLPVAPLPLTLLSLSSAAIVFAVVVVSRRPSRHRHCRRRRPSPSSSSSSSYPVAPLPIAPSPSPLPSSSSSLSSPVTRRRTAAADVTMSRCRHRRSHRAAATALPPLGCVPPPQYRRQAAAKLPPTSRCRAAANALPPPSCHRRPLSRCRRSCRAAAAALPPPPRHRQAAADLALSRCRRRRATVRWLVVALLSTIRFCHRMPSCDHQRSRCRPLLLINPPPAITTLCDGWLLRSLLSRRSSEHHQQLTNVSTILFTFTFPVNLDLFNLSTVFSVL